MISVRGLLPILLGALLLVQARANDRPSAVSFARDVRPILAERCVQCHGPDPAARKADLRLDRPERWSADLGGRAAIVPGEPESSELLARVRGTGDRERMPPPASNRWKPPAISCR